MNPILEQLKKEARYAQRSFSKALLYQTYGKAQMALQLGALTHDEFMGINHMTVFHMNTDQEYIRHRNKEFFENARFAVPKIEGGMKKMLHPVIPKDKERLQKGIEALEYQIRHEADPKSKAIFQETLGHYRKELAGEAIQ